MQLTHPEQPNNPPEDTQFFGPENDDFWPCWYKFADGEWWGYRIDKPEKGWFSAQLDCYEHTLGQTIFLLKESVSIPDYILRKDTQRLCNYGTGQLRWANDRVEYFSRTENNWRKSNIPKEAFENQCPPLADLNWPPETQESNDVDSW